MGLFRKSCIWVQRYEEHFIPPNKIANIFQLFSLQENWHIAKLCEPTASARNYLYNTFFVQSGQVGRRGEAIMLQCYNVTCNNPPNATNTYSSPKPPCNPLPLSILQSKTRTRRKPSRHLSSARVFTFVNKKPPSPTLFSAQKTGKSALDSHKNAYFCRVGDCVREVKNRAAAVATAPKSGR